MKLLINKRLIILMCLLLSICSIKIRKEDDKFVKLKIGYIKTANKVLLSISDEINGIEKEEKSEFFDFIFKKTPKPPIFFDATFALHLTEYIKNFILDEAQIRIKYIPDTYRIENFKYKCRSSEELTSDLRNIDFERFRKNLDKYSNISECIAHHIVLRKCFEKEFQCKNYDTFCILKNFASQLEQEMIIFEPGDHKLTIRNIWGERDTFKSGNRDRDTNIVIPKENVNLVILYSSRKYFLFKTQDSGFNFTVETENFMHSEHPYLILFKTKEDKNKKELGTNTECPICLLDLKESEDLQKIPCGHRFHKECWLNFVNDSNKKQIDNPNCPFCRKSISSAFIRIQTNGSVLKHNGTDDPFYMFFKNYQEYTEKYPDQYFIINEKYVIDKFNRWNSIKIDHKKVRAKRFMYLISEVFYLKQRNISKNIQSLP